MCTTTKLLPADVFKMMEGCIASLEQKVRIRMQSDAIIVEKEPERLKQLEAIREQATMLHESRLNKDKVTEESVVRLMRDAVIGFMAAVDQDKEDGLDPDTARLWKEQVQGIVTIANLDVPAAGASEDKPEPAPQDGATDCLAPLKNAIDQARYTADAVTRELADPEETVLRGFGKQLGSSRKEIMALSKNLAVGQPASVATEATRLASEACGAIKVSRESIRAALREMGAASDISEASGPIRSQPMLPERPSMGRLEPAGRRPAVPLPTWPQRPPPRECATGPQPAGAEWVHCPPLMRAASGDMGAAWPPLRTPATSAWPPAESLPRPRIREEEGELSALMRGMMNAQANDNGWPTFSGKFKEYPRFRKEWWAYRQTYHGHVRDELVCRSLKEKSLASNVRLMVNDIDDLREVWDTLNTCYDRPDRYISEALDPVVKFRVYKPFDSGAIREFYSLLRAAMMGARKAGMLGRLINDQTLLGILARMPPMDWRQWARERPNWMREATEEAFWNFVDQKWRDALNVAAAEPPAWGTGSGGRVSFQDGGKKETAKPVKSGAEAVHVTEVEGRKPRQGDKGRACIFKGVMGCAGTHPPWFCRAFGKLPAREREKLIVDNKLCPFCLLHDRNEPCGAKQKPVSVVCTASGCRGRHAQKLHDLLKDVLREEGRVHVLQEDDEWEESEEAWELGEAEAMIVGAVRQEGEYSWQDACDAWAAQDGETEAGVHHVGARGVETGQREEDKCEEASEASQGGEQSEAEDLLVEGEEREYILELLMREMPPDLLAGAHPAKAEFATLKGKRKRKLGKKLRKKLKLARGGSHQGV